MLINGLWQPCDLIKAKSKWPCNSQCILNISKLIRKFSFTKKATNNL